MMSSDSTMRCLCSGRNATTSVGRTILRTMRTKLGIHYAFHSPSSCMLPLHRLVTRKTVDVRAVSRHIHSVLHMGFVMNLFSTPCRASLERTSMRIGDVRGRTITLRTSHRSIILLGGASYLLPLSGRAVGAVDIYKPGTSSTDCTLARCKPLTMRMAAILRNVRSGMKGATRVLCAGNYRLISGG